MRGNQIKGILLVFLSWLSTSAFEETTLKIDDLKLGYCNGSVEFTETTRFDESIDRFCVKGRVIDTESPDGPYFLNYRVDGEDGGGTLVRGKKPIKVEKSWQFVIKPNLTSLYLGNYRLAVMIQKGKRKAVVDSPFLVESLVTPKGEAWDQMMEVLRTISGNDSFFIKSTFEVTTKEVDDLKKTAEANREEAWDKFWEKRNPDPEAPRNSSLYEFRRRISYSYINFTEWGRGSRSDRGKIYIKYGPPEDGRYIDLSLGTATGQGPNMRSAMEQIWEYPRLRTEFVFIDYSGGFGSYKLAGIRPLRIR